MNKQVTIESLLMVGIGAITSGLTMIQSDGSLLRGVVLTVVGGAILIGRAFVKKYFYDNNQDAGERVENPRARLG